MVRFWSKYITSALVLTTSLTAQQAAQDIELNIIPRWALSGYLESGNKAYVVIKNQKIESISDEKPQDIEASKILETNDWISPGFIDMHNHLSYNVLPLWNNAQGQFDNRFEWRDMRIKKVVGYDTATSLQMEPFNPRPASISAAEKVRRERALCAGIRWAEVKALMGGATVIQGYSGESVNFSDSVTGADGEVQNIRSRLSCAESFLIPNLEINSDLPELPLLDSKTDLVDDLASWGMNEPYVYPRMEAEGISYDEAVKKVLEEEKLFSWIKEFNTYSRSVSNGLRLALGKELPAEWLWLAEFEDAENVPPRSALEAHADDIYNYFVNVRGYKTDGDRPNNVDRDVKEVISWIYGPLSSDATSFLKSKAQPDSERTAYEQLGRSGIHSIRFVVREFAVDFYNRIYLPIQREKQEPRFRMIAHLSEGRASHAFTRREFKDVVKMGLAFEKSIFIHGVGLDDEDLDYAKDKNLSFVWSPLSNLLLYNETIDVPKFLAKGINLSLAPDWVVSGSKSVLFELKAARMLFDKWISQGKIQSFSNKDLVALVTTNPAKALSMEEHLGKIEKNFYANLLVVKKQSDNIYDDILKATENDIKLTVVTGLARSGEKEWMEQILSDQIADLENLDQFSPNKCVSNKVIYLKDPNPLDEKLTRNAEPENYSRLEVISQTVHGARARQRQAASPTVQAKLKDIDPLFDCDSPNARKKLDVVITAALPASAETLAEQQQKRKELRNRPEEFLGDEWRSKYLK